MKNYPACKDLLDKLIWHPLLLHDSDSIYKLLYCPENVVCLLCLLCTIKRMPEDANTMIPDQTAPKEQSGSGFILFGIEATKVYIQIRGQTAIVMNGIKRVTMDS